MSLTSARLERDPLRTVIDGLSVEVVGKADGPAILLSAGLGGSRHYWERLVPALALDYMVVLYDHRGTGESARTALPAGYGARHLADDIAVVLRHLDVGQAHVIGHAAGGIAGLALAADRPELVRSLVVVNGWGRTDPHTRRCFELRRALYAEGGAELYLRGQPLFLYPADWISANFAQLEAERHRLLAGFQDEATLFARIDALLDFDLVGHADRIRCPVALVATRDDMLVPSASSLWLKDNIGGATIDLLDTGGHAVNVTCPSFFNSLILRRLADTRY